MARDDSEFSAWVTARWPDLVRALVFLGHPPPDAERIALEALARVLPAWERLRREDDVDVALYREAFDERRRWPTGEAVRGEDADVLPGLTEQAERRAEVEAALAAMPPADRAALVLRDLAELADEQVAAVLGERPRVDGPSTEDVRFAAGAVPVASVHADDVRDRLRARRRRAWRRGVGTVAALGLVLAAVVWWTGRPEGMGEVRPATNPLPVPWYADGVLHLAEVEVDLDGVRRLVVVPDGVVLSDEDGDVVMVDEAGVQQQIGDTVPDSPLVAEAETGWVGWADPGTGTPELVVHDTTRAREIGRRSLAVPGAGNGQPVGDDRPIAIDDGRVYFDADDTVFAWEPLKTNAAFGIAGTLVDAASGSRLVGHAEGLLVKSSAFSVGTLVPAVEGSLTRDGRYAFARDEFAEMVVYDVMTGQPIERMYSPSDVAVSWGYVDDGSFLFAVLHKLQDKTYQDTLQMPSEGEYRIYHCDPLRADPCEKIAEVDGDLPEPPIIAR
ncbi:hypothetical protein [Nocardioides coralli]|uniref:hypothetical protein n=1 Tax=Nocardioides coralli TaxID=2872154 RepID=UPI001CA42D70|nr:hypothetical protein [Nocardioides coralli]QZY30390.1 hypothetical protein K6T13_06965 [Nocardioides coralli]